MATRHHEHSTRHTRKTRTPQDPPPQKTRAHSHTRERERAHLNILYGRRRRHLRTAAAGCAEGWGDGRHTHGISTCRKKNREGRSGTRNGRRCWRRRLAASTTTPQSVWRHNAVGYDLVDGAGGSIVWPSVTMVLPPSGLGSADSVSGAAAGGCAARVCAQSAWGTHGRSGSVRTSSSDGEA